MDDLENQNNNLFDESIWKTAPLFAQDAEPQTDNNKVARNLDSTAIEINNVELQTESDEKLNYLTSPILEKAESENGVLPIMEHLVNLESSAQTNVEPHTDKNKTPPNLKDSYKTKSSQNSEQNSEKKSRSQKRNVIPKKFFVLPEEEEILEKDAKGRGISFSNYIRFLIGLNLNEKGRKKRNVTAAFSLDDLHLDE